MLLVLVHLGLFDLTEYVSRDHEPSLRSALETNAYSTQSLITSFIQLSAQKQPTVLRDEAYRQCQKAQTEVLPMSNSFCFSPYSGLTVHRPQV